MYEDKKELDNKVLGVVNTYIRRVESLVGDRIVAKIYGNGSVSLDHVYTVTLVIPDAIASPRYPDMFMDQIVASFTFKTFPGNASIQIVSNAFIQYKYRNRGIGTLMNQCRIDIGKALELSALMCTVASYNVFQLRIMEKNGWTRSYTLKKKGQNSEVHIYIYDLTGD